MKKIWQKSLASMVSAALCLTAFVGCLTVNAADYQGTVTSEGVSVTTEKDQATVTLTLSSDHAMNVAAIKVLTEYGSLASVNVGDYKDKNYKIEGDFVILDTGKLLIEAIDNDAGFTTADVVLTFNKAADIGVGTYPVQVSAFAGETAATWDEETVNLAVNGEINIVVTEPVVDPEPVEEDYITYTGATYDIATSELTVGRAAPGQKLSDALKAGTANGNRKVQLVLDVNGAEFLFDAKITSGTGAFTVSGFALPHMNVPVSIYVRITADNDFLVNTNAYNVVLADVVAGMAETDTKAAALVDLIKAWSTTEEVIDVTNAEVETGAVDYTTVTYAPSNSELVIGRAAPSPELKNILKEGNANGNRKVQLVLDVNGAEFLFDAKITSGAGTFAVSGFALPHFTQNVKVYIRVTSGASGENVVNTNAVTVNLDSVMKNAADSAFAAAYNAYCAVE